MNFLKKKLKTVVHGKRNKDDDDDFDNYIPEVPPHPSVNYPPGSSSSVPHFASTSLFDAFNNSVSGAASSALDFASSSLFPGEKPEEKQSPDESKLTLEELKAREEEHKRQEKEKLKEHNESKKDNADWQFFLSLTAKVDAVTSKTQSILDNLKDNSAVNEIAALEEQEEYGEKIYSAEEIPKTAGGWVAFEENVEYNPSDPIFTQPKIEETKKPEEPKVDIEKAKQLEKQLLDDFGFGTGVEDIKNTVEVQKNIADDIDPFDTSSFDIEAIKAGKTPLSKPKSDSLLEDFDIQEVDPFDTSHIESVIATDLTLNDDNDGSYTPYSASGYATPFSGAATPLKRRNSTNPFELSPEEEENPILKKLDQVYQEQQLANRDDNDVSANTDDQSLNNERQQANNLGNVASAIADMTADFCQSISMKNYDFEGQEYESQQQDDVFSHTADYSNSDDNEKPISTVKTIQFDNNGSIFDPFETIHDEDGHSSKRSSIEVASNTNADSNQQMHDLDQDLNQQELEQEQEGETYTKSSKAKELFNSSMASFEILAQATGTSTSTTTNISATTTTLPQTEQLPDVSAYLSAPPPSDVYNSDLSDLSDVSPTNASSHDARSAFHMYDDKPEEGLGSVEEYSGVGDAVEDEDEDLPPPPPMPERTFDPFATVLSESTITNEETTDVESYKTNNEISDRPRIGSITGESVEIFHVGNPNAAAEGLDNEAYTNEDRKDSIDVVQVETENIQPNDLRELVEPEVSENVDVDVFSGQDDDTEIQLPVESSEPADPFDTEAFDAFDSKFQSTLANEYTSGDGSLDPFASPYKTAKKGGDADDKNNGFDTFQPFELPKQPENTPFKVKKKKDSFEDSDDDDDDDSEEEHLKIVIRTKKDRPADSENVIVPLLPPPPKSPRREPRTVTMDDADDELAPEERILTSYKTKIKKRTGKSFLDDEFDRFFSGDTRTTESAELEGEQQAAEEWPTAFSDGSNKRQTQKGTDSPLSPQTPLYDEDTSQPLEDFPPRYVGDGWDMMLRYPAKKKLTANRCWKKIFVRFIPETGVLQLFNKRGDPQPFQEQPIQASYSISEISAQQYDQYGKIFTIKVQYIFYRERVGVRPGQIAKVMQGQIQSMGDFARLGMPVEHAPQISELLKIGSLDYFDLKQMVTQIEEAMFRMSVHRDRALTYRTEEIQCVVQDELYVEQSKMGLVEKQLARVRVFFLAFLNGVPEIDVGVNDLRRQGKEVVGRHDILPVVTEEWIRVENPEFHACVQPVEFDKTQIVKLIPPDACHFELMRFRIRPPRNRELPLQVSANMNITPSKMELKCDVLVPGCISRKHGQIPCEDISIRFHIPECWIYFFRVEKHFRMGAVHSTNRRSGKLKGFERILGATANPEPQLIEVTAGQAKYEHAYHSIVWRIPRLPKEGQGAYTQQLMVVRLPLGSFDRIPESFYDYIHVEFVMPSTTVSHTTLRSISVNSENPPEKFVRYVAKYEYKIGLSITYDDTKPELEYQAAVTSGCNNGGANKAPAEAHSSEEEHGDD